MKTAETTLGTAILSPQEKREVYEAPALVFAGRVAVLVAGTNQISNSDGGLSCGAGPDFLSGCD